jgi:hypothetical protein
VASNSTVSGLTYDSEGRELSFTVTGSEVLRVMLLRGSPLVEVNCVGWKAS